jgi:iron(III) transport system permease protein
VALALVFFGIRVARPLYQTLAMLVFAYVVLFLPQAVGAIRTSLLQVPSSVEEASRTLGSGRLRTLGRVLLPLSRRGALAGGALVFLTAMKELPATLLLGPTGYTTLATSIWDATREAFFARAAAPALMLILLSGLYIVLTGLNSGLEFIESKVGVTARRHIEALLGSKIYLDLHIKVSKDWQRDPKQLRRLGF